MWEGLGKWSERDHKGVIGGGSEKGSGRSEESRVGGARKGKWEVPGK